jgi:hypothetical protein
MHFGYSKGHLSKMSPADQLKAEDDNNSACIKYARENLGL